MLYLRITNLLELFIFFIRTTEPVQASWKYAVGYAATKRVQTVSESEYVSVRVVMG